MRCRECAEVRRFAAGSVYCILFGIIIRDDHICTRKGNERHERDDDQRGEETAKTELYILRRDAAGEMPGVLPGSGERAGLPGMDGREEWEE